SCSGAPASDRDFAFTEGWLALHTTMTEEQMATNPAKAAFTSPVKIRFVVGQKSVEATLDDGATANDFVSLLPLELELNDLFAREKSGQLPRALFEDKQRTHTYEVGDIVYWPPGPHVAVFYRQDGRIVAAGMIRLGTVDAGVDAFAHFSTIRATIELAR